MAPEIKKVMLIFPPAMTSPGRIQICTQPLGILYLGTVLQEKNYDVCLLDALLEGYNRRHQEGNFIKRGLQLEKIMEKVEDFKPDAVGISCLFSTQFPEVARICRSLKARLPGVTTITGGTHPTFLPRRCLEEVPELDYIIRGEGERALLQLLEHLNSGRHPADVGGLAWRKNGEIKINPPATIIEDIDILPFPDRSLLDPEKYWRINLPFSTTPRSRFTLPLITSRGCTGKCVFCSSREFWGRRYRTRSPENVFAEISSLKEKFGVEEIDFLDDNITLNISRARAIFQGLIDRNLNISWSLPNGVAAWKLDNGMLRLMKASGCYQLTLGLESGDQECLTGIIRKPLNLKDIDDKVSLMKKLGIRICSFICVGFPGEKPGQIKKSLRYPARLGIPFAHFFTATPLPGTDLTRTWQERGEIGEDFDFTQISFYERTFDTREINARKLNHLIRRSFLFHNLRYMFSQPVSFFRAYFSLIRHHPRLLFQNLFSQIKNLLLN